MLALALALAAGCGRDELPPPAPFVAEVSWQQRGAGARVDLPRRAQLSFFGADDREPARHVEVLGVRTRMVCCGSDGGSRPQVSPGPLPHQVLVDGLRATASGCWQLVVEAKIDGSGPYTLRLPFEAR